MVPKGNTKNAKTSEHKRKRPGDAKAGHAKATKRTSAGRVDRPTRGDLDPAPNTSLKKLEKSKLKKQKREKNASLISSITTHWETLRQTSTPRAEKEELVNTILDLCGERIGDVVGSSKGARVMQSCVKYGSVEARGRVWGGVVGRGVNGAVELSKNPYGRFVMSKLVMSGGKEALDEYFKAFKGKAPELLRHPAGTHVLDDLYTQANAEQRRMMAAEFYGKEYSLFASGTLNNTKGAPESLGSLLAAVEGQKQLSIVKHLASTLTPVMEKGLVDNQLAHRLIAEYLKNAPPSLVEDAVESLSGEALLHMIHTHEGTEAACMVLAYGSAKDRKKAIKAFKGHVGAAVADEWGYLAVCTALGVVDDTSLLRKNIVTDIQSDIEDVIADKNGHKVLLQLLSPFNTRYFTPELMNIMKPRTLMISKRVEPENEGDEATTVEVELGMSKKDALLRRQELLKDGLWKAIATTLEDSAADLLKKQFASDVVVEACIGGEGGILEETFGADAVDAVHSAVLGGGSPESLLEDFFASRAIRRIVISSNGDSPGAKRFTERLYKDLVKGKAAKLKETHAGKIVAALVGCGCDAARKGVRAELKKAGEKDGGVAWAARGSGRVDGAKKKKRSDL